PKLVPAPQKYWSRREIAEWLRCRLAEGQRLLIGFGFPFEDCGYLGDCAKEIDHIFGLWALIEARSAGEDDFGCGTFVGDPEFAHLFWKKGPRPQMWVERK